LFVPIPDHASWPEVHVLRGAWFEPASTGKVSREKAVLSLLSGSWVELDRARESAMLRAPEGADPSELIHPFLASVAVVFSWWHARNALHGGAFAASDGCAWALLGPRGCGKSTTLAALSLAGFPIVSDDLIVVEGHHVLAGPRSLDLRPEAVGMVGHGTLAGAVRGGSRRRMILPAAPSEAPLAGWLFLGWGTGTGVSLRRLSPSEWLARTTAQLNSVTPGSQSMLPLAGGEAWELIRPRGSLSLEAAVDEIRSLVER
jgi:hypothetical protein